MLYEEIEVVLSPTGEVKVSVTGVKGEHCEDLTAGLISALGGEVVEHERTAEYYEAAPVDVSDRQRLGQ